MRVQLLVLSFLLLLAACSTTKSYVYQPAVQANAQANGYPAAYFPIPTGRPTGDVRIASFGVTDIQPSGDGPKTPALQVRMIIANNSDEVAWALDTREIVLALGDGGTSRPAVVNSDAGEPPYLQIPRGQKATVDLFYPLPPSADRADRLPSFDLLWEVRTGTGPVAQRTPFEREQIEPSYAYTYPYPYGSPYYYGPYGPYPGYYGPYGWSLGFGLGWGSSWWYRGGYPYYRYHDPPGNVVVPGPPHEAEPVRPQSRWWGDPSRVAPRVGGSGGQGDDAKGDGR